MEANKISVIVPVYKAERYLRDCLDSLVSQTHRNLEIILVEDGSPDGSGRICDEYAARDNRIRVIHQKNSGASAARNAGLAAARGDWIGFVDADDRIEPDMFAYLFSLAQEYGADISQCGVFFEENDRNSIHFCSGEICVLENHSEQFWTDTWDVLSNCVWNKLYRAEVLAGIEFCLDYSIGEDQFFLLHALIGVRRIVTGTDAKYHYVLRADSISHKEPSEEELLSCRKMLLCAIEKFSEYGGLVRCLETEFFRNEMDVCSRIVRFYRPEFDAVRVEICRDLRRNTKKLMGHTALSWKDKLKLCLIAWWWNGYRMTLLFWKRIRRERAA